MFAKLNNLKEAFFQSSSPVPVGTTGRYDGIDYIVNDTGLTATNFLNTRFFVSGITISGITKNTYKIDIYKYLAKI